MWEFSFVWCAISVRYFGLLALFNLVDGVDLRFSFSVAVVRVVVVAISIVNVVGV